MKDCSGLESYFLHICFHPVLPLPTCWPNNKASLQPSANWIFKLLVQWAKCSFICFCFLPQSSCFSLACDCSTVGSAPDSQYNCDNATGQCFCKDNVFGRRCDECKDTYWNLTPDNPQGCLGRYRCCFASYSKELYMERKRRHSACSLLATGGRCIVESFVKLCQVTRMVNWTQRAGRQQPLVAIN